MNVAVLGNTCPHLHWSIVPREMRERPVTLSDADRNGLVERIRRRLGGN